MRLLRFAACAVILSLAPSAHAETITLSGIVVDASASVDPRHRQPFSIPAGETGSVNIIVSHYGGTAYNLTGAQLLLTVRKNGTTTVISRQATIDVAASGIAHFPLVVADTLSLFGPYTYDVWLTDASGNRYQVVTYSPWTVTQAHGQPGQAVTVPATQQPLAQGPAGPSGVVSNPFILSGAKHLSMIAGSLGTGVEYDSTGNGFTIQSAITASVGQFLGTTDWNILNGAIQHYKAGVGTGATVAYSWRNDTPAASGLQQWTGVFEGSAQGFASTPVASRTVAMGFQIQSVQGTTNPSGIFAIRSNVNGAGYGGNIWSVDTTGNMNVLLATTYQDGAAAASCVAGTGAVRYSNSSRVMEKCENGGGWVTFGGGGGSGDMLLATPQVVTGSKTFQNATMIVDNSANTFASTLASAATAARTWTLPDATDTAVGIAAAQTLTNKTLTSPVLGGATATGANNFDLSGGSGILTAPTGGIRTALLSGNSTDTVLQRDTNNAVEVFSNAIRLYVNGGVSGGVGMQVDQTDIRCLTNGFCSLGAASNAFKFAVVGAAVASQPTCDSTTRGAQMTIFATAGNSDMFQICMKAAADTYAWRTVFTAP